MRLQLQHIGKKFGGITALDDVSFSLESGEVHAICGENGAGKSTLMNILAGVISPDTGEIYYEGKKVSFSGPQAAINMGISCVYQHLSLVENLSVAENIFPNIPVNAGSRWMNYKSLYTASQHLLTKLGADIPVRQLVRNLSASEKQIVEITKALARNPNILILDEPTASLTKVETYQLGEIIKQLKQEGVSIVYISHRLQEIFQFTDRITVLKDGRQQGTYPTSSLDKESLIRLMVGRDLHEIDSISYSQSEILLEVKDLSGQGFRHINLVLHRGEILGLAGLHGAGRTELARAVYGAIPSSGRRYISGHVLLPKGPAYTLGKGISYLAEDRKTLGLFLDMTVEENILAGGLEKACKGRFYSHKKARKLAEGFKNRLGIVCSSVQQSTRFLSGGNQQKVSFAKCLFSDPDVLIVDEPTHGVDIGAKQEIYRFLKNMTKEGKGIFLVSSELTELLSLCDRIIVMRSGIVHGELSRSEANEEKIMNLAM